MRPSTIPDASTVTAIDAASVGAARDRRAPTLRRFLALAGPGAMVAVGYMDPGNWATDLGGGAHAGYALLSVVLVSSMMAMVLQAVALRLGIATRSSLAEACRDAFPRAAVPLWILAEIAIVATDVAEVVGSAIALELLLGLPFAWGVGVTVLDVLLLLALERKGMRALEAVVVALVVTIGVCFVFELALAKPDVGAVAAGLVPRPALLGDHETIVLAIGILGATVMPHNLYLHSGLVQPQARARSLAGRREQIRHATWDSNLSLGAAFFVNAAILVLAAAVFHDGGREGVRGIGEAHRLLAPLLGGAAASVAFALALLASGQSATMTGTLAGQIVMEGFVRLSMRPWARRLLTRALAVVPVLAIVLVAGRCESKLLVGSQVVLGLELPFAVVPMMLLASDRARMGELAPSKSLLACGWATAVVVTVLEVYALVALV